MSFQCLIIGLVDMGNICRCISVWGGGGGKMGDLKEGSF